MMSFSQRLGTGVLLVILLSLALLFYESAAFLMLHDTQYFTGWTLVALLLFLTVYNARKKMPVLPLGSSSGWLQLHIYAGTFTLVVFLAHLGFGVPDGMVEGILAVLMIVVIAVGYLGLYLSRKLPPRMNEAGEVVLYERIPHYRAELKSQVRALVERAVLEQSSSTLPEFYSRRLDAFLSRAGGNIARLMGSRQTLHALLSEANDLERYLNDAEVTLLAEIKNLVSVKDALDFQQSAHRALKLWLFVHIPLTYSLLLFAMLHVALVYAYMGELL